MTKPVNIEAIERVTGKKWTDWRKFLESKNARELTHTDIAKIVNKALNIESGGWWAQNITVAYEQEIGRRAAGQRSDGMYEISVSKTIAENKENVYAKLVEALEDLDRVNGEKVINKRTSQTPIRNYWRCDLENGNKITMAVETRKNKSLVAITHTNMKSDQELAVAKSYWKKFLDNNA